MTFEGVGWLGGTSARGKRIGKEGKEEGGTYRVGMVESCEAMSEGR